MVSPTQEEKLIFMRVENPNDDQVTKLLLDYAADTALRVRTLLVSKKVPESEKLEPAIKLVARVIDEFSPAMFEINEDGVSLERRTNLPVGAFVVAMADHRHTAAVIVTPQPGITEMLVNSAREMRAHITSKDPTASIAMVSASVAHHFLNTWGWTPGGKARKKTCPDLEARNTMSALFAVLDDNEIRHVMTLAGRLVAAGYCPAFIVMMAPDDSAPGIWVGRWPLLFPMAPYVNQDTVLAEAGSA